MLYLIGGVKKEIDSATAKDLKIKRFGKGSTEQHKVIQPLPEKTPVEVSGLTFYLKDIKWIDDQAHGQRDYSTTKEKREELLRIGKERREEVSKWSAVEKADRMTKTYCYLLYKVKGNKGTVHETTHKDPLYSQLMSLITPYFEENPKENYCPADIYKHAISSKGKTTGVSGWKSVAEVMGV